MAGSNPIGFSIFISQPWGGFYKVLQPKKQTRRSLSPEFVKISRKDRPAVKQIKASFGVSFFVANFLEKVLKRC